MFRIAASLVLVILPCAAQQPFSRHVKDYSNNLAPYVSSPQQIVDKMLEAVQLKPGETLYDLGCGDGRVLFTAAERYRAKAVGVEISESLVKAVNENIRRKNLMDQVQVIHENLLKVSLVSADVVVIYLETGSNDLLRPNLERDLKAGSRVVSHDFVVPGWKASRVETMDAFKRPHTIYVYDMPQRAKR
jgi:cyclopropane fatty-acyl-phospholipid synthase-like methyltransferase